MEFLVVIVLDQTSNNPLEPFVTGVRERHRGIVVRTPPRAFFLVELTASSEEEARCVGADAAAQFSEHALVVNIRACDPPPESPASP